MTHRMYHRILLASFAVSAAAWFIWQSTLALIPYGVSTFLILVAVWRQAR